MTHISSTQSGFETRQINWSKARHQYDVSYGERTDEQLDAVIALFHAVRGKAYGFRFKDWKDYKSVGSNASISALDQLLGVGNGTNLAFQLVKIYNYSGETHTRTINKPVAGSVLASIQNVIDNRWTVDTTTGLVTFSANITKNINAITKAVNGKITFTAAHTLIVGNTFHVSSVAGMTQINGKRVKVIAVDSSTQVTTDLDTSGYSTYTSGGVINTIPQTGEQVRAGYEFDVPVRFDTDILNISLDDWRHGTVAINLVEIRL